MMEADAGNCEVIDGLWDLPQTLYIYIYICVCVFMITRPKTKVIHVCVFIIARQKTIVMVNTNSMTPEK